MANFNFNKVILGGRLTADPELKQTSNGIAVISFTIAVSRRFAKQNDQQAQPQQPPQQTTDFIDVVAWRQQAELIARYFHKGSSISVVGTLQKRQWTDQQGNKRYTTEVVVEELYFVDSKDENSSSRQQSGGQYGAIPSQYIPENYSTPSFSTPQADNPAKFDDTSNDDDLPF